MMKLHKLLIFAIMIFAAVAAMTNDAAAKKKTNRNWVVFTGNQVVTMEGSPVAAKFNCASSGIYATANFASPVDLADGFYVTIAADGELLIQEKMTVDNALDSIRSIPVDLVPDDDAELGFPTASLAYSRALLTELNPGIHKITIAVSVGEGEQISAGNFTFDNRRGCAERFERVETLINGTGTAEVEQEVEPTEEETGETRPRLPQDTPTKPQGSSRNYIDFFNNCSDERRITYVYLNGTTSVIIVQPGYPNSNEYPVGTKFWHGNGQHGASFFTLGASEYVNEMDKARSAEEINLCQ